MSLKHLAPILEIIRDEMNRAFEQARTTSSRLNEEDVLASTQRIFAAAFPEVPEENSSKVAPAFVELYKEILKLCAQGWIGASSSDQEIEAHLVRSIVHFTGIFWNQPRDFLASVVQGYLNVKSLIGDRSELWSQRLARAGSVAADLAAYRSAGVVAAWREGLTSFRSAALKVLAQNDGEQFFFLLDRPAGENCRDFVSRLEENPWNVDSVPAVCIQECGSFVGFGGQFAVPPLLVQDETSTYAFDSKQAYRVESDAYGSLLILCNELPQETSTPFENSWSFSAPDILRKNEKTVRIPLEIPRPILSVSCQAHSVFVTSATSHRVFVLGIPDA